MMRIVFSLLLLLSILLPPSMNAGQEEGPVRILFLGHDAEHHPSNEYYPMLAQALGRDGIYFDYHTSVEDALGDYEYLSQFDGVLLYANHDNVEKHLYENLLKFVEEGGGFVPVHCASFCFRNQPGFVELVGGQFAHHRGEVFAPQIVEASHPAVAEVSPFEAWDETYVHTKHGTDREILMVREPNGTNDNIKEPEPWTWVRTQGKGRVFYTASGHDQRVWSNPEFHQLLKSGILWAVGDERRASYDQFVASREPFQYEKRDNIPNYERRPEPLPYQLPLSPEDSLDYTQVPVGWRLELFASEPDIINPMQLAWDERGRLWVIETTDYPNENRSEGRGNDKIKILEDTNGDGRADKVTVFADGLNIPTSLTFANGGVIVQIVPDTLFLKDTDGDDRADVREVLISGWGTNDTHAGPSNLRYGLDNQIWGTVGYAGFRNDIGGEQKQFGMGVYRFPADGSNIEFLHQFNNNTWGLGFNDAGDVFGSTANNHPSFYCGIPMTIYPAGEPGLSAASVGSTSTFHPITPNIRQVDVFGGYTAGAGHSFANSDAFPESWRGTRAFVAGPTGNLLGQFDAQKVGAGYETKNAYSLVASADEWFSPVAAEVGPDGHLWIADWYNFIIQHNPTPSSQRGGYDARNGAGNAHVNPNRDREHGRIYRLIWDGAPQEERKSLAGASPEMLLASLGDGNQFWRLTAQRLLVDGKDASTAPALTELVSGDDSVAATHALWSLHGLNQLDGDTLRTALNSSDSKLRRNAVRALPRSATGGQLLFEAPVINDPDLVTRLAAFVAMAEMPTSDAIKVAIDQLMAKAENREDRWLDAALKAAALRHGVKGQTPVRFELGPNLLANATWSPRHYAGRGVVHEQPDNEGVDGGACLKIVADSRVDSSLHAYVDVKPNTTYRLSGKIKTSGVSGGAMGALFNVHELGQQQGTTRSLTGDNDWTEISRDVSIEGANRISINCLLGGWGQASGTAWYDEIELRELTPVYAEATELDVAVVGDIERGKSLFYTHQVAACNRCHQVGGEGGIVGPALDGIATRKAEEYLRESLLEPNAAIAEGFPAQVSPMPPMNLLLKEQEIEDLMAYLLTLEESN